MIGSISRQAVYDTLGVLADKDSSDGSNPLVRLSDSKTVSATTTIT